MRGVWAAVIAVWALLAVAAVLAWTRPQSSSPGAQTVSGVVVKAKKGVSSVVVQSSATHATTRTSKVPAG
ncbi:MAG: hypothetical protein ACXVYM_03250 [Gaiellaceae bacterium]